MSIANTTDDNDHRSISLWSATGEFSMEFLSLSGVCAGIPVSVKSGIMTKRV